MGSLLHHPRSHEAAKYPVVLSEVPNRLRYGTRLGERFVLKTNQAGLQHRKEPKKVVYHAFDTPFQPIDRPDNALYLHPLNKAKEGVWYQKTPVGHNWLVNVMPRLFKRAGVSGKFTNHSATTATHLFDAGVDEQLIMSCTGHSSTLLRVTAQLRKKTSRAVEGCYTNYYGPKGELRASDSTMWISFSGASIFTVNFHF